MTNQIFLSVLFYSALTFSFSALMEILEYFINKKESKQYGTLIAIIIWTLFYYFSTK